MCLIKKRLFPKISIKPIIVYKIIVEKGDNYFTPTVEMDVELNSILKAKNTSIREMFWNMEISSCGVHAYISLEEARKTSRQLRLWGGSDLRILKCIIPPYTLYWEGEEGDIAARKLKLTTVFIHNPQQ